MGSIASVNPVHLENGWAFRVRTERINILLYYARLNSHIPSVRVAHDKLLANKAFLDSMLLSNSGNGLSCAATNLTARDYMPMAYSKMDFVQFFDQFIMEARQ